MEDKYWMQTLKKSNFLLNLKGKIRKKVKKYVRLATQMVVKFHQYLDQADDWYLHVHFVRYANPWTKLISSLHWWSYHETQSKMKPCEELLCFLPSCKKPQIQNI